MKYDSIFKATDLFYQLASFGKKKPEAPEWAPFGQYAWSNHREGMPDEPDNEIEKIIYSELKKHFGDYHNRRTGLPLITTNLLMTMMELGWYESVLHPPPNKTLYRGIKINSKKKLAEFLDLDIDELDVINKLDLMPPKSFPIQNGHSTSWTAKKKITKEYSETDKKGNKSNKGYAVTLIADVKDNPNRFIAGPGGLYDVRGMSLFHLEKETVGLEPINIKRVEWEKIS